MYTEKHFIFLVIYILLYDHTVSFQECIGKSLPTRMECISPVFPRDETEEGELSFDMDGALGLWDKEFSYHPYGEPIPFETEGHVLSLYPGFDEVSLHVRDIAAFEVMTKLICFWNIYYRFSSSFLHSYLF